MLPSRDLEWITVAHAEMTRSEQRIFDLTLSNTELFRGDAVEPRAEGRNLIRQLINKS